MPNLPQKPELVKRIVEEPVDEDREAAVKDFLELALDAWGDTPEERQKWNTLAYASVSGMSDAEFRQLFGVLFVNGGLS
jgi:hypothetical protein